MERICELCKRETIVPDDLTCKPCGWKIVVCVYCRFGNPGERALEAHRKDEHSSINLA